MLVVRKTCRKLSLLSLKNLGLKAPSISSRTAPRSRSSGQSSTTTRNSRTESLFTPTLASIEEEEALSSHDASASSPTSSKSRRSRRSSDSDGKRTKTMEKMMELQTQTVESLGRMVENLRASQERLVSLTQRMDALEGKPSNLKPRKAAPLRRGVASNNEALRPPG